MPRIKIYESQVRAPGPVNDPSAPQANAQMMGGAMGEGLKDLGQGVTKVGDLLNQRAEQNELSDLNAYFAKTHADYTKKWQDTIGKADPSDTSVVQDFTDDLQDNFDTRREQISTRAGQLYFDRQSAEMSGHFLQTANAGQAELAGEKARNDYKSTVDNLSASLINDPSSFKQVLQQHDDALGNLVQSGLLPQKMALQLKERYEPELAKAAVRGWIRLDPDGTEQTINNGGWDKYLSGDDKYQMQGEVRVAKNAAFAQEERLRHEQERQKKEAQNARQTEYLQKMFGKTDTFNIQQVLDDNVLESFGSGSKEQLINMYMSSVKKGEKNDYGAIRDAFRRINLPDGSPDKITDENDLNQGFIDGHWDSSNLQMLRNEINGKKTASGAAAAEMKSSMVKTAEKVLAGPNALGMVDPEGGANYIRYLGDFLKQWDDKVRSGTPASKLIDPKSPDYMGNMFLQYQKSTGEIIDAKVRAVTDGPQSAPSPTPQAISNDVLRKSGESPADYLKRRGMK